MFSDKNDAQELAVALQDYKKGFADEGLDHAAVRDEASARPAWVDVAFDRHRVTAAIFERLQERPDSGGADVNFDGA
jgi:hypothetical protein